MSIVTFKKPTPFVSESDWQYKVSELKAICDDLRADAFQLKSDSHRLRDETDITTHWNKRHTDAAITDRLTEISRWKNLIQSLYEDLEKEVKCMQDEKKQTEEVLESINLNFKITNYCMSIRDERRSVDCCYDAASVELDTEQCALEVLKKVMTQTCQDAWEQINKLQELRMNVAEDLDNKINTICMDTKLLEDHADYLKRTYLRDQLRVTNDTVTYKKWLQWSNHIRLSVQEVLVCSKNFRETMYQPRNKTKNDLRGQNDRVNHALRRRIYETNRIKNELEWQKLNMLADKEKMFQEIQNLENALSKNISAKMVSETRYGDRQGRQGPELCTDKTEIGLNEERVQIDISTRILMDKFEQTKCKYNALAEQINVIEKELDNKEFALKVEQKCLEVRKQLEQK